MDIDPGMGLPGRDVDDGLAFLQAIASPELEVDGVSVVFGNAPQDLGLLVATELAGRFGRPGLKVHPGASSPAGAFNETAAVSAMARALRRRRMTILALGPVTNVASLLRRYPTLASNIEQIVVVAGRRPGQKFANTPRQLLPHRDFNFELDSTSMQTLLDSSVELTLVPWEISSDVWITRHDLDALRHTGGRGAWVWGKSQLWISLWESEMGARGFNPFDTLAVGWLTHPQLMETINVGAWIDVRPDDRDPSQTKPYLLVSAAQAHSHRRVRYATRASAAFKRLLLQRLGGRARYYDHAR